MDMYYYDVVFVISKFEELLICYEKYRQPKVNNECLNAFESKLRHIYVALVTRNLL